MSKLQIELGPLTPLIEDSQVMEIMINGPDQIYVERRGELIEETGVKFRDEEQLLEIISNILTPLGRKLDESHPLVDVRLPDGSRVNVVGRPIALNGPAVTIRRFAVHKLSIDDLIGFGSWNQAIVDFLAACIKARLNIVVAGGTGSGKTTVFNLLTQFIPEGERIVTVENAAELDIQNKHVVRLESRPANLKGEGEITISDLVINALRMRPDRLLVGEARSGEVLELFQAMRTGHDGTMFTMHANNPRDALARLEVMGTMADIELPLLTIREMMGNSIDIIVQQQRLRDGKRKIMNVTEVLGMQNNMIAMRDIFEFVETGYEDGQIQGQFATTGVIPKDIQLIREHGDFPDEFFAPPEGLEGNMNPPTPPVPPAPPRSVR